MLLLCTYKLGRHEKYNFGELFFYRKLKVKVSVINVCCHFQVFVSYIMTTSPKNVGVPDNYYKLTAEIHVHG